MWIKEKARQKVDITPIKRKSRARTFRGKLIGDLQKCRNDNNKELAEYIEELIRNYDKFYTKAEVKLENWKGKSGIKVINKPDSFDIITYQKAHQEAEVKEIRRNILKREVNRVILAINSVQGIQGQKNIKTKEIAGKYCKFAHIEVNSNNEDLFRGDEFRWDLFFSDRFLHTELNQILRLLDFYKIIIYRGGHTTILNPVADIQVVLK